MADRETVSTLSHIASKKISLEIKKERYEMSIQNFDLDSIVDHSKHLIIGKRQSGKSWLIRSMISHLSQNKKITKFIVFAPNKFDQFYEEFIPRENIYFELKNDLIKNILEKQRQDYNTKGKQDNICIVLDDCFGYHGGCTIDETISELLFNGRHYCITTILSMQYPLGIKPELRCNFDYVHLFADDSISNQKRVYEQWIGVLPNFETFRQFFFQLTNDYGSMCIVKRGPMNSISNGIRYHKASDVRPDKGGLEVYNMIQTKPAKCDDDEVDLEKFMPISSQLMQQKSKSTNTETYNILCKIVDMNNSIVKTNEEICKVLRKLETIE